MSIVSKRLNPKLQRYGDTAVLTYNLVNYDKGADGTERASSRWNPTSVYHRTRGKWRMIHSHWSFTQPALKQ